MSIVALVYDADGKLYDECYTWEAGQNYALHEGRKVVATKDDGFMSMDAAQELYDSELVRFNDCYKGRQVK